MNLNPEDTRHALWHFGHRDGYAPRSFTTRLLSALDVADPDNQIRLASVYPHLVAAYVIAKTDGIDALAAELGDVDLVATLEQIERPGQIARAARAELGRNQP